MVVAQGIQQPEADMRWLWSFILAHRGKTAGALISGIFGGIAGSMEPFLIGVIIDHTRAGAASAIILQDVALIIGFGLFTVAAFYGQRYYSGEIAYDVNFDVRRALFDNLLTLDQAFFNQYATGDLISRMHADVDMIWRLLALGFNRFGSAFVSLIFIFMLLASVNIPLTLIVFAVLTISTSFQIRAGLILAPMFEQVQEQAGTIASLVQDTTSGIQTLKTFGREAGAAQKFHEENLEYKRRWLFFKRRNEPVGMLPNMISQLTTGIVVLFGGILTLDGSLTLGNFAQFLIYLGVISVVLLQLGTIYQRYQQTRGALIRITPLLQPATIRSKPDAVPFSKEKTDVEFDHVSLTLEATPVLRDISLRIPAGAVVAFVGPTGCGKTMLVSLLARVHDPTEGCVRVGGVDVRDYDLESLREGVAYVPQSTFLFSQTMHENMRMGKAEIDDEDLHRAVHISRVSNDLPQLPYGLETLVGEKGVMLSGGQKQRVAIARAIVRDSAILVLDDALSSVDTHTAADILSNMRQVLRSRTSLIIAHRIATVKDADFIVVIDDGRIREIGTHSDLIARDGLYARMVEREFTKEDVVHEYRNGTAR
jgi:ATP-binding cassette subfamily B multidrug efflux pump